jgi:hypothetical protein
VPLLLELPCMDKVIPDLTEPAVYTQAYQCTTLEDTAKRREENAAKTNSEENSEKICAARI